MADLKEALQKLDVANENHWTQDGLPRLETVKFLNGGSAVTREEIEKDFPGFDKSTAAGYWLTYQAPAAQAPQGGEAATPEQGGGDSATAPQPAPQAEQGGEAPSANGDGAAPAETKAPEPADAGAAEGAADSETELAPLVEGLDGAEDGSNEIENLEAALSQIQEHLSGLRGKVDSLNQEIDSIAATEAKIYNALQKARRNRGDHKPATHIQQYLAAQKRAAEARGVARKAIVESGVNLKELAKLTGKSPLDQSMARATGRGRGSKGM
jgi:hypothetical protein